ncbi:MAG: hypothetical protein ACYDG2_26020, partial [Ruminiclostridium sp.]
MEDAAVYKMHDTVYGINNTNVKEMMRLNMKLTDLLETEDGTINYLKQCEKVVKSTDKIGIFGAGRSAAKIVYWLNKLKWGGDYFFIDNNKEKQQMTYYNKRIISPEELLQNHREATLIISCADAANIVNQLKLEGWKSQIHIFDFADLEFEETLCEYIYSNISKFEKAFSLLQDEYSKRVFSNILNYRISRKKEYLQEIACMNQKQYFDEQIWQIRDNMTFVDAGAYVGDTVDCIRRLTEDHYHKII